MVAKKAMPHKTMLSKELANQPATLLPLSLPVPAVIMSTPSGKIMQLVSDISPAKGRAR